MRFIMAGALLCALASTAFAEEHYAEVWNPPEVRQPVHRAHVGSRRSLARHARRKLAPNAGGHSAPHRVTGSAMQASAPWRHAAAPRRHPGLTPQIGPNGHPLQVGYHVAAGGRPVRTPLAL
ncbi:hypothetical protein [Burkholderia sp. WAC0059]|uniref:hypothetical protein n=1 Tax=Burkholderia sp. WAC0059 TaxID=2066022 RepID=UPI0011AEEAD5|nr:hypothetical protein [Burkholderia sp. WAC0059]